MKVVLKLCNISCNLPRNDCKTSARNIANRNIREQGWRNIVYTRLPPIWLRFDSRTRRHMWVEFVVSFHPSSEDFSQVSLVFPPFSKTNIAMLKFDQEFIEGNPELS